MLLNTYRLEIFNSECNPRAMTVHCFAHLNQDVSEALPYLNAELGGFEGELSSGHLNPTNVEQARIPLEGEMLQSIEKWKVALVQAVVILAIALVLGLVVNALRNDGIAMVGDWSAKTRLTTSTGESLIVSLTEAEKMFMDKAAVFMDARSEQEYDAGHIQGAISLPWHEVEHQIMEVVERISPSRLIITYCDGETCALSKDLVYPYPWRDSGR